MTRFRCHGIKYKIVLFLILGNLASIIAQTKSPKLFQVLTIEEIYNQLYSNKISSAKAAQELAILGEYEKADILIGKENIVHVENANQHTFEQLIEDSTRIVIFNESHHIPRQRQFLSENLKTLSEAGFKYLALETLTNDFKDSLGFRFDDKLIERGFPYFSQYTGIYSKEPEYGKLIREAIELGFEIVAYEMIGSGNREYVQAKNIYNKTFNVDRNAKVVILCGYHHIFEKSSGEKKMMAAYLREITGQNPLTFYQLNAFNRNLEYKRCDTSPLILSGKDNKIFYDSIDISKNCDYFIYHFSPFYYLGVPNWKLQNQDQDQDLINVTNYLTEKIDSIEYPIIGKLLLSNEPKSATPIEIFQIDNESHPKYLFVNHRNSYKLVVIDMKHNELEVDLKF